MTIKRTLLVKIKEPKVTGEILRINVLKLLQDLEQLQLIRLQKPIENSIGSNFLASNLKGAMTKQAKTEIDKQLLELH